MEKSGPLPQQLHLCDWRGTMQKPAGGTDKVHPSKGTRTDGSTQQRDEFSPMSYKQLNISTNQIRRKKHTEKLALLFHPSVPKPFAFHFPVLERAISCPHPLSLDYSQLQGSAPLEGCVSRAGCKRQRRGIMSCGHRSAQCGRSPWDSQQTR